MPVGHRERGNHVNHMFGWHMAQLESVPAAALCVSTGPSGKKLVANSRFRLNDEHPSRTQSSRLRPLNCLEP